MKQLSEVLSNTKTIVEQSTKSGSTSSMEAHGSIIGAGKTNIQLQGGNQQRQVSTKTSPAELPLRLVKLVENNNYDWSGNCEFDENGKVIGFKRPSTSNNYRTLPIPTDPSVMRDAFEAKKVLDSVMKPATPDQIAVAIKKLSLHCGMQAKAPEEVKFMFLDYCKDLEEYPISLIEMACAKYRKMPEGNNFLPSSGKLISFMSYRLQKMKFMKARIDKILGIEEEKKESLSLTDVVERLI